MDIEPPCAGSPTRKYESTEVLHISYTMCTCGLPDIYTLSPRASGVHIRQITRAHGITITYVSIIDYPLPALLL